jgi:hypothetical protein
MTDAWVVYQFFVALGVCFFVSRPNPGLTGTKNRSDCVV